MHQKKRGRPRIADVNRRDKRIEIRFSEAEYAKLLRRAAGKPISTFIRNVVLSTLTNILLL